jgi:hypothetical protein
VLDLVLWGAAFVLLYLSLWGLAEYVADRERGANAAVVSRGAMPSPGPAPDLSRAVTADLDDGHGVVWQGPVWRGFHPKEIP